MSNTYQQGGNGDIVLLKYCDYPSKNDFINAIHAEKIYAFNDLNILAPKLISESARAKIAEKLTHNFKNGGASYISGADLKELIEIQDGPTIKEQAQRGISDIGSSISSTFKKIPSVFGKSSEQPTQSNLMGGKPKRARKSAKKASKAKTVSKKSSRPASKTPSKKVSKKPSKTPSKKVSKKTSKPMTGGAKRKVAKAVKKTSKPKATKPRATKSKKASKSKKTSKK